MKRLVAMFKRSSVHMARVLFRFVPLLMLFGLGVGYGHTRSLFLLYTIALFALLLRPAKFKKDWKYVYERAHCIIPVTALIVLFFFVTHILQRSLGLNWLMETFIGLFFVKFFIICLFIFDTGHGIVPFTRALYYSTRFIMRNMLIFSVLTVLSFFLAGFFLPFFVILLPVICVMLVWWYTVRVYPEISYYCEH